MKNCKQYINVASQWQQIETQLQDYRDVPEASEDKHYKELLATEAILLDLLQSLQDE